MAELGLPKTWREAIPFVVWGVLVLAFGLEFVPSLLDGKWWRAGLSGAGMVILMAAALHFPTLKKWIVVTDPRLAVAALMTLLLVIALS